MLWNIIAKTLLKGLDWSNGWKTWAGIGLAVIVGIAQFFDVVPAEIPTGLTEIIPSVLIGLGLGDKMGKERAALPKKK